ncbi:dynein axonemal intermediate chain 3 [Calliopsis andreniformis]|uniref:dynein axonemal intermediate chain 3 n=1 Tax=Calliopsis andreniformis TaxID=337506 RepID=UPI003FCDA910
MSDEWKNQNEGQEQMENDVITDLIENPNYEDDVSDIEDYEHVPRYEDWDLGEQSLSTETIDWEKEAQKTIHIEFETPTDRRRTIFQLDSYASSGPSKEDILKLSSTDITPDPRKQVRYSVSMGVSGIARIHLSPLTQKVIGCVIGENVSTEYPWVYVRKEIIEDNIDLHEDSSDFLPIKDEIRKFPNTRMLIGYVPSLTEKGQFYICLTEEGRDAVVELIQRQREEHENRVRTAVYKPLGEWKDLGSSVEVRATIVENTRPLLEIEFVSTADVLNAPVKVEDRKVDDQRDGYIELLPYRQTFENVSRQLMYKMIQVTPAIQETKSQTVLSIPMNCWTQYLYEYQTPDISAFTEDQLESLKSFLHLFTDEICDELTVNATWDIYRNDYEKLVKDIRDTQWSVPAGYKEHLSFHEGQYVVDKVINDLSWHPLWTGVMFAAYTRYSKSQRLVGPKSREDVMKTQNNNYVLLWSFNDSLTPKLVLECPREVTAIAVNPLNGNLIVGGCANGQLNFLKLQVVIWHIPGKIEKIEAVIVSTPAQVRYRRIIRSLITWLLEVVDSSLVKPTAMSSLKFSQKATITKISWISPYDKLDENGRLESLPEDTAVENLSLQFVTASEDGTIAFWDLKLQKFEKESRRIAKRKVHLNLPEALRGSSQYKYLDRIFRPHYLLIIQHPNESRRQVVTTLTIYSPQFEKVPADNLPPATDITVRRYYKNVVKKSDYVMTPKILIGTVEGDFGCITWEGYEFTTDVTVNSETCQWCWSNKVHDGPVTHAVRTKFYKNIVATVGGKIFAIWRDDLGLPLIWKKSKIGYSACSWGVFRSTILILARIDGSVEIWDFVVKSGEPCVIQSLSGRIITGIYTHELYLKNPCIGFCDFNGIIRLFLSPTAFVKFDKTNIQWMNDFLQHQNERVNNCRKWQKTWTEANYEIVEAKDRLIKQLAERRPIEAQQITQARTAEKELPVTELSKSAKPWELIEAAREKWKAMELKRMQQVILEKKGLRKEDLEKQREPILKMRQEAKRKKEKLRQTLAMQEDIFEHTVAMFFPEHQEESKQLSLSSPMLLTPRKTQITDKLADSILQQEVGDVTEVDPEEEILYNFLQTQAEVLDYLQKNPFVYSFDWRKVLTEGKSRRVSMDYQLHKNNRRKSKLKHAVATKRTLK